MTSIPKTALILIIATSVVSCAEQNSIEKFSTEEIVTEFHARFEAIGNEKIAPWLESLPYDTGLTILSPEEAAPYKAKLENISSAISPFVNAGYTPAMLTAATLHLLYGFSELFDGDTCKGLKLARDVVLSGGTDGASAALLLVDYFKIWNPREDTAKTSLFWSIWFQHLDPELEAPKHSKVTLDDVPQDLLIEWTKWSPKTDPGLKSEIERVCSN